MFPENTLEKARILISKLEKDGKRIATAESCTGGLISALITEIPGASKVFERGFVTYSNESKIDLLTVPTFFIEEYGAVSMETATAMAEGALLISRADISIAVTGCAGPDGGTKEKPVGTVFIACASKSKETICKDFLFSGTRQEIRLSSVVEALNMATLNLDK